MTTDAARRDRAYLFHPYTNLARHPAEGPFVVVRGEGVRVFDETGRGYIEGMAGLWCAALGFSEPRLAEAGAEQLRTLPFYHLFGSKSHLPAIDLAERLVALAPKLREKAPLTRVLFANSGSEANDSAVKLIRYYNNALGRPAKKKIISRQRAYHGVTVATASLTGLPNNHRDFDLPMAGVLHTECPHHYRGARPGEDEDAFSTRLAASLDQLITAEGPDTVAAFFAEPVMGAGGVVVPPAGYFEKVQAVLRQHDVLLVADEVICGFGRTGAQWGSELFGLEPDILTCAKALSAGAAPISATLVSETIWQACVAQSEKIGVFGHGFTYSAHPVAAAIALEALKIYQEREILSHIGEIAPHFQAGLRQFADHPLVGEVRGVGLVAGVELVADKATKAAFPPAWAMGARVAALAQKHGLIIRAMGDTLAFAPPLIITRAEIDEVLACFGRALIDANVNVPAFP